MFLFKSITQEYDVVFEHVGPPPSPSLSISLSMSLINGIFDRIRGYALLSTFIPW